MTSQPEPIREFLDQLRRINAETGASAAKQFMWKNRELVVKGLAENQRIREALEQIRDCTQYPRLVAREALAGDAE